MDVQWTLVVEGLGRIERAEVRLHPLMLFVGENNSGKSYLASLLWGLVSLRDESFPSEVPTSSSYKKCDEWLLQWRSKSHDGAARSLDAAELELFLDWFNSILDEFKNDIVSRVFNDKSMSVAKLQVQKFRRISPFKVNMLGTSYAIPVGNGIVGEGKEGVNFWLDLEGWDSPGIRYILLRYLVLSIVMGEFSRTLPRVRAPGAPLYLPASRTGFVLLYKSVVSRQIGQLLESERERAALKLTRPAVDFLNLLAVHLQDEAGACRAEADFLEQDSINGRVALEAGVGVNEYRYYPAGSPRGLPMALSSSLVTELAPIILALRHIPNLPLLILEEPEAHLHPRLQRLLAQVLVRLVRKGVKVWVTTHSENFCQQINNFLKLGQLPNRMEVVKQQGWPYGEQDYLEPSEVVGYQFVNRGATSVVSELEKSPVGLTMPTFNDELMRLMRETLELQRLTAGGAEEGEDET
jgi:hypothetical protein